MNLKIYGLGSVVCGLLLSGCVQAPPPASLTESWVPPRDSQKTDTVWQELRAQSPDPTQPLSLSAIADIALQNNPATRKAWNDARAASEQIRYAQGYFMPSLTAGAGLNRVTTAARPESFDQNNMSYGPGLQLSYLICNFGGGRSAAVEQALQTVYAANFAFNRAIQDTLLNAEIAYYTVISAQAGLTAASTNALDAKTILDAATTRRNAGLGVDLDVLQAQTAYDQSLYALTGAQGQLQIAQGLLAQAVGLPADNRIPLIAPDAPLPASLSGQDVRRLTDEALARRPDLSALRATLASRQASIRVARASRWPSLYGTASATRDYYELYGLSNRASQSDDWAYTGGLSVKWNLFDGFQTLSTVRTAEAQTEALRAQLKQAELGASAEIWARFQNYETALQKYKFSAQAMKSASASLELAFESYQSGVKTILDLLNAENQLAQTRSQQVSARQEVFTALANLAHATGITEKGGTPFKDSKDNKDARENR
jgi:TolC family type I secretion outer membrane protein